MHRQPEIPVAVVGVGRMGYNHARIYAQLKGADLVGVYDVDAERASAVAASFGVPRLASLAEVAEVAVAASVAVSSSSHLDTAAALAQSGVHLLIEKPLAPSLSEAERIATVVDEAGIHLLVGHVERFNPAVRQLEEILQGTGSIRAIDARRMSAVSARVQDIDVVGDLMIHDIDIMLSLVGEDPVDVVARSVDPASGTDDYVTALLTFPSGVLGTLTASRITQNQVRALQVTSNDRFYAVDYPNQEVLVYRQGRIGELGAESDGRYVLDVGTERVFVRRSEPLANELSHFLDVVSGEAESLVTARDAIRALRCVERIRESFQRGNRS